ncbi:MAG: DNA-3-methyladenine glycosylase I [Reinekea sp.]|nr:DNA-3-methyladenine glycosylase I [Reinekea sp.]
MTFEQHWQNALMHHQDDASIRARFPSVASDAELLARTDAQYLSLICRRVFRAGMKHSVVDSKWPAFEEAFWSFDPMACQLIDDARFEELMRNTSLIRHWGKMKTVPINAMMVSDIARQHGSVGAFLANWPEHDIVGLWLYLKKHGAHLGGDGASRFLRMVGKDTFVLTDDVVRALQNAKVISKKPTGLRDLKLTQEYFNQLKAESGLPLSAISMVLALSVGPS